MFCCECGAKNKKDAPFCEECGAKLDPIEEEESSSKKETKNVTKKKKKRKKLTKFQIIIISAVTIAVIALIVAFCVCRSLSSPEKVVEDYITAIKTKDYNKLYKYANIQGDSTFINKEIYMEALENYLSQNSDISDYVVESTTYQRGNLYAVVTLGTAFNSGINTENSDGTVSVRLTREKEKQFLFFPKWTITDNDLINLEKIENFEIIVPKDTTITYDGVKVSDKYLQKNEAGDYRDTYVLPQVLASRANIEFVLPGNLKIKRYMSPSTYSKEYKLSVTEDDLTKAYKESLEKIIGDTMGETMNSIIANKKFEDIKDLYADEEDSSYYEEIADEYEDYRDSVEENEYTSLTGFTVDEVDVSDIYYTNDYELRVSARIEYSWEEVDKDTGETDDGDSYGYFTYYLIPEEGEYKVVGISSLPSTISLWW